MRTFIDQLRAKASGKAGFAAGFLKRFVASPLFVSLDQPLQMPSLAPGLGRLRGLMILGWLWLATILSAEPVRFLIGVDVSYSTARSASAIHGAVKDVISSGFMGQIRPGESYGVWLYSERVQKLGFEVWTGTPNGVAIQSTLTALARIKPRGRADFRELLAQMAPLARTNQTFTLVLVTDGEDEVRGTPFDAKINRLFEQNGRQLRQERRGFLVGMLAEGGYWVRHTISETGFNLELPLPTQAAAAASLVEQRPTVPKPEAARPAEPPVDRPTVVVKPVLPAPAPAVVPVARETPKPAVPTPVPVVKEVVVKEPAPPVPTVTTVPKPPVAQPTPVAPAAAASETSKTSGVPVPAALDTDAAPSAKPTAPSPSIPTPRVPTVPSVEKVTSPAAAASVADASSDAAVKTGSVPTETVQAPASTTNAASAAPQALLTPLPVRPGGGSGWGVWAFIGGLLLFLALWFFRSNVQTSGSASLISQSMDKDGPAGRPPKS